jgi:hypothetical protein
LRSTRGQFCLAPLTAGAEGVPPILAATTTTGQDRGGSGVRGGGADRVRRPSASPSIADILLHYGELRVRGQQRALRMIKGGCYFGIRAGGTVVLSPYSRARPVITPQRAASCWPVTPDLLPALLCRQARLSARDLPSSLARNSEQNDNNRGNPHRAISIGMRHCERSCRITGGE